MILNDEDKRVVMEEIKRFFFEERDEEIGQYFRQRNFSCCDLYWQQ